MASARVNIQNILDFIYSIDHETSDLRDLCDSLSYDLNDICAEIEAEKREIDSIIEQCQWEIDKLQSEIDELEARISALEAQLAALPPTIIETRINDDGEVEEYETPNPERTQLEAEISDLQSQLSDLVDVRDRYEGMKMQAESQSNILGSALSELSGIRDDVYYHYRNIDNYSSHATSKLNNIRSTLEEYSQIRIPTSRTSSYVSTSSFKKEEKNAAKKSFASSIVSKEEYKEFRPIYDFIDDLSANNDYKKLLCEIFNKLDNRLKYIYRYFAKELNCISATLDGAAYYSKSEGGFKINSLFDIINPLGKGNAFFHVSAFMIEDLMSNKKDLKESISYSYDMYNQICIDYQTAITSLMKEKDCKESEAKEYLKKELEENASNSYIVSDIFAGLTLNLVKGVYVHEKEYWKKDNVKELLCNEVFAELSACIATSDESAMEFTKKYLKNSLSLYDKILEEFINGNK